MKRTRSKLLLAAAAVFAIGTVCKAARPSSLQVVPSVDVSRYMGRWYEIAHLPAWFQRKCAGDTTATYTLRPDGRIAVLNQCRASNGSVKTARGIARPASSKGPNSKLKVSFFWPFSGDYWVIDLDPEYRWAVVGEPRRRYLWILSRQPQMPPELLQRLVERAARQGYRTERLIYTRHAASVADGHTR